MFVYVAVGPIKENMPLLRTVGGVLLILLGLNLMGILRPARLMGLGDAPSTPHRVIAGSWKGPLPAHAPGHSDVLHSRRR